MSDPRHAMAMEVFLRACELTEDAQRAFLDQACGDDSTLRAEVTSLLKHHRSETILADTRRLDGRTRVLEPRPERPATERSAWLRTLANLPLSFWLPTFVGITVLVLALWTRNQIYRSLQASLRQDLNTVLEADVRALQHWVGRQKVEVESWAEHADVSRLTEQLQAVFQSSDEPNRKTALQQAPEGSELYRLLQPIHGRTDVVGVIVFNTSGVFLVHMDEDDVGESMSLEGRRYLKRILNSDTVLVKPMKAIGVEATLFGPLMAVAAPIRGEHSRIVGGLAFVFPSDDEYSRILSVAQLGVSGETYAFDDSYTLLSNPRHPELLVAAGRVEAGEEVALAIDVRVPGTGSPDSWPPTKIVEAAVRNKSGTNVDGYPNYLGQRVVGVSKWLDELDFGVCTEISYEEAFAPVRYVDRFSLILVGLNFFFAAVSGFYTVLNLRLRQAVGAARQLGSYTLGELIGEGGMGKVYLAKHALLRRPTAVKLLDGKLADQDTVDRFEREVQLTSQLTHPNTIQIYDFGRSSDDVFYFAMEYLRGPTLTQLVELSGALPAARAVDLLMQACRSLKEAHDLGLIHRDVKPANIMVCRRGGCFDVVKVLDFGLVKSFLFSDDELTQQGSIGGTPAYIAPERLRKETVDHRSDIFSLGAVGYYLLTGRPAFQGETSYVTLERVLSAQPTRPSEISDAVPDDLEDLVLRCLAKSPADRPADLGVVISELTEVTERYPWTQADARGWWEAYEAREALERVAGETSSN